MYFVDHGALMNEWEKKDITAFRFWDGLISHKIVTLTEQTRQDYIKRFKTNPKKIRSIYNWIPEEVLKARRPYDSTSKRLLQLEDSARKKDMICW